MYASATSRWRSSEKISVTLTGMPAAIVSSIAGRPAGVAGIFTSRFGRSTSACRRLASSIVASVSYARFGSTSSETQPSLPSPSSQIGAKLVAGGADVVASEREEDLLRL